MHQFAQTQFMAKPWFLSHLKSNHRLHVSDTSISRDELAWHQKRSAENDLTELIRLCRDQYCYSHELISPHATLPDRLFDRSAFNLTDFFLPWAKLCTHYRRLAFDPQIDLFEDQRARELRKWDAFLKKECFARFTRQPEWTRCVLETADLRPPLGPKRKTDINRLFQIITQDMEKRYGDAEDTNE